MIPDGAFVWTNFPFGQPQAARRVPGPGPHVAYTIGNGPGIVLLAYTSSGPWRGGSSITPPGVVEFGHAEAASLNQKAFHIDLRVLARVTPTPAWFPHWGRPGHGVIATAGPEVRRRILEAAKTLIATSPASIETRGVGSDTHTIIRRPG